MIHSTHNNIVSFIWATADNGPCYGFARGKYRNVILSLFVLRRLNCLSDSINEFTNKFDLHNQIRETTQSDTSHSLIAKPSSGKSTSGQMDLNRPDGHNQSGFSQSGHRLNAQGTDPQI
jgi:hypothetical protein